MKMWPKIGLLLFLIVLCSCEEKQDPAIDQNTPVLTLLNPKDTKLAFKNTSIESLNRCLAQYDYFYNGSGLAIGDLNNDGLPDVFMAGNDTSNKLFLNEGDLKFKDITKEAGLTSGQWSTGVTMIDVNEDGYLDIYVCNTGPTKDDELLKNKLYINNGDLTFKESSTLYGVDDASYSSQSVFLDYDKDGDLDLFVLNHSIINYGLSPKEWEQALSFQSPEVFKKSCNTLYRNEGNGKFVDVTETAGLLRPGFGLGVSVSDFNEDGFLDLFISNDYFVPDFLYLNNGNGTFIESIKSKVAHTSFYSMGCDAADFNNDGLVDLAVVDMTPSDHYLNKTLMESMDVDLFAYFIEVKNYVPQYMFNTLGLNRGYGIFSEIANFSGVSQTGWSWAPLFVDLDNNSEKDLIVTNGFKRDTKDNDYRNSLNQRYKNEGFTDEVYFSHLDSAPSRPLLNYIYQNNGDLSFTNMSKEWGFEIPSFSNGAAYGDLDNDGDLDVVINNLESMAFVYKNNTSEKKNNHFLQFELRDGKSTSKVLYSKIKVYSEGKMQLVEYSFVRGYLSTMQPLAHFGLGAIDKVDKVEIIWPDGKMHTILNPKIDKRYTIDKNTVTSLAVENNVIKPYFLNIADQAKIDSYQHVENKFDEFKTEILLPHRQSTLGPGIAVGDVNGDGLDDFYVGGGTNQAGELYLQGSTGIIRSEQIAFKNDSKYEDINSLFFDADGDKDLDLYVASGGGGDKKNSPHLLQDRLYLNSGDGTYKRANNNLPKIQSSTKSIEAMDWDGDGDLDLFVGGRTTPGMYPVAPESFLLQNNNGVFKNVTVAIAPELKKCGMITDSCWSDIDNDGRMDLIVVGEWMPITVFLNKSTGFVNATKAYGFQNDVGWWQSIEKGDFDNDGDEDFIVGNIGLNNKFHPSKEKPFHIFSNDFDKNGTLDIVLSKDYKGKLAPVRGKECSTQQMPFIGKKFPMYSDFASSTLEDIYGIDALNEALHFQATNFASMYIENKGDGTFVMKELPVEAQIGSINGIIPWDFDRDGNLDLVLGGNVFNTEVETPAYDAGKGLFLKGNGDGTFKSVLSIKDSGLYMPNNLKDMEFFQLTSQKAPGILTVNNNGGLELFAWMR